MVNPMLLDPTFEMSDDVKLILGSIKELLDSKWDTKKFRSVLEGNKELTEQLWKDIIKLEILPYISNSPLRDAVIINELIGSKLLPGIIASSVVASRGIKSKDILDKLFSGEVKIAVSDSNYVPGADQADLILIDNTIVKRKDAELKSFNSLDNSMKKC